ncbi:MAG: hypothetical protein WA139_03785 [Candidatus Aenigmatarchaeota archaeon]
MSKEEWIEKTIEKLDGLEAEELENLKENIESKLKDKKKDIPKPTPPHFREDFLYCNNCDFKYIIIEGHYESHVLPKTVRDTLIAVVKGKKELEEIKEFFYLEQYDPSTKLDKVYEKVLAFSQKHENHDIEYHTRIVTRYSRSPSEVIEQILTKKGWTGKRNGVNL